MLRPLGWVCPRPVYFAVGLIAGGLLGSGVAHYVHLRNHSTPQQASMELLLLALFLGPILEESFFRGCLLPLLAHTTGNLPAVILTAFLFALFHQPTDLAHWVSFTVTGVAYGWIRVVSRSTVTGTLMYATYNLALWLSATV